MGTAPSHYAQKTVCVCVCVERSVESVLLTRTGQRFVHELLLGEAQPPFAGSTVFGGKHTFADTLPGLLAQLLQVLTHLICAGGNQI